MSSFGDKDKASGGNKDANKTWEVLETLAEIQKNKSDVLKITRVKYGDLELINFQVWRTNTETLKTFPLKEQKVSFNIELKDKVREALS